MVGVDSFVREGVALVLLRGSMGRGAMAVHWFVVSEWSGECDDIC